MYNTYIVYHIIPLKRNHIACATKNKAYNIIIFKIYAISMSVVRIRTISFWPYYQNKS